MEKIKTPLWLLSGAFAISFLDGMLYLNLGDGVYLVLGLAMIVGIGWMWVEVFKAKK